MQETHQLPENSHISEPKDVYLELEDHLRKFNVFSLYWDTNPPPYTPANSSPLSPIYPDSSQSSPEFMRFDDDLDEGQNEATQQQINVFNSTIPMDLNLLISIPFTSLSLQVDLLNISLVASNMPKLFNSILRGLDTSGILIILF